MGQADAAVVAAGQAAAGATASLRQAPDDVLDDALRSIAARLGDKADDILRANAADVEAAKADGLADAFVDRLALDQSRIDGMSGQLVALAQIPPEPTRFPIRTLDGELELQEWRRPVGVIGANFEARPNVVVDVASQLIKSRNGGVLRTGSAAVRSAAVLVDDVVAPALADAGLNQDAIQLLRFPGRESAVALVHQPALIPLVILRGSGDSTRALALEAAAHGVRTLAHADGGAVLYIDPSAEQSLDRLGVCNRLNLLLIGGRIWDTVLPRVAALTERLGIAVSLPPHHHPLGHEWALDPGAEATVTIARAESAAEAAAIANRETSRLAASIVTTDATAAREFLDGYAGTGAFWNATTRLLDGFKLLCVPETGINIDSVPGPRGPVTFRDLYLRQYAVVPKGAL
jgi:glutamate-5-semialdehyde dehydrogenase